MRKISIIGSGGAGKSTLARALGRKTGIPTYHLDALFWQPGWIETERGQWRSMQEDLCSQEAWILDGTMDIRLKHSDTIIFLDINRFICLARVIWRNVRSYGKTRLDMAPGCTEHFDPKFIKWILGYPTAKKPEILRQLQALPREKNVIILNSLAAIEQFLANIPKTDGK